MELSYTAISTFNTCPYSYYLRYVKRVSLVETSASVYGSALHKAIKIGYENNLKRDEWIKAFKREWVILTSSTQDIVYSSDSDYINKLKGGQAIVGKFYDKFVKDKEPPKLIEYRFSKTSGVKLGTHTLVGVFDQISNDNSIWDYKSSYQKATKEQLDFDLQFTIYSYAYRILFNEKEKDLVLVHLPTCTKVITNRDEKDFEILVGEVDKMEQVIKNGIFVRNLSRGCSTCYFLEHCLDRVRKYGYSSTRSA